jgi:hypothetical protein
MKRLLLLTALVISLGTLTLPLVAADLPVVRQPSDSAFSAADRAAMASAWVAIQDALKADFSPARFAHLQGLSWSDADFVQFAAGTLQAAGYTVLLATGFWGGMSHTWILVTLSASFGPTYVPVEAVPALLPSSSMIGQIAWQDGVAGSTFDVRYLTLEQAVALPPSSPPSVAFHVADPFVVVDAPATLMVTGSDPSNAILAYLWAFPDGTKIADTRLVFWYTFRQVGEATVNLTAISVRGARTNSSDTVNVLETGPAACDCHGH